MTETTEEIVSLLKEFKLPKTVLVKCQYCGSKRDQSNMARHYKSEECTWTPEEALRRKTLEKLRKKRAALQQLYEDRLAALKAKFDAKIKAVDDQLHNLQ